MAEEYQRLHQEKALTERLDIHFALKAARLGVWELDPVTDIINWDDRCRELFGLVAGDLISYQQATRHIHPDDTVRVGEAVRWAMNPQSGGAYDLTYRTIGANDEVLRWVRFVGKAYFNGAGEVHRFAGIAQDVTKDRLNQQIEASEAKFRALIEEAPVATCLFVGRELIIEVANEAMIGIWGKGNTVLNKSLSQALPELAGQPFLQLLTDIFTTGKTHEAKATRADLEVNDQLRTYYFDFTYKPLRNAAGDVYAIMNMAVDVTKQVTARQQMEVSEARYRTIFEQAPMAVGLLRSRDMIVEAANDRLFNLWGKDKSRTGLPLIEVIPEIGGQGFIELLQSVYDTGIPFFGNGLLAKLKRNGVLEDAYFDVTYTPWRNADDTINGVMVLATEVTEQVITRKAVEASEAKLRSVIATAPAAMGLFVGRDLVVEMPNQAFIDIVGKGPDIVGKPLRAVMPELESQAFLQILDDVYTSGKMFQSFGSQVNIVQQGVMTHNFYNITYTPLFDAEGEVYAILDIAIDVTEQVMIRREIEASQQRFRTLLEAIPPMTWTNTPTGDVDFYNQRWYDYTGLTLDQTRTWEAVVHPDDLPRTIANYRQALATGQDYIVENRYRRADGAYRWHLNRALPICDEAGQITQWIGTATDIHKQKELEAELEQQVQLRTQQLQASVQDLQRSNQNLQQFAYVASHDLQEPLRKIQSFGDIIRSRYADQLGEGADHLQRMQSAANRMSVLIKDLLTYSRISTQQEATDSVSLNNVVQSVLMDLELVIEETGATVNVGPLPTVQGDASQLSQLFQNLLNNSLKFRRPGISPIIQISTRRVAASDLPASIRPTGTAAAYHRIEVSDNGIGFDDKYIDRIFQVFQRLHGRNEFAGTGIGLAICEKVVSNHGGAIAATSQPGHGAAFSVYLPALYV